MQRVLAFGCHPDDVEWHVGGTLALLAQRGWQVHIATMAGGEVGTPDLRPQEIRARRLAENARAAALVNGQYHYAGGHDLQVRYTEEYLRMAVRVMRAVDPALVIAPPPADYLVDHEETSRLVRTAAFIASVPLYDCGVPTRPTRGIPHLYYCNAMGGTDIFGRPLPLTCVVDVTDVLATKRAMLACHESQREWLKYVNGLDDYLETMAAHSAAEGALIGAAAGEAFIQHKGFGHPQDDLLRQVLGACCVALPGAA